MNTDLIDRIYECSFLPELWPGIMDELARITDARGGQLFSVRGKSVKWTGSANLDAVFHEYVHDGWFATCNRGVCVMGAQEPRFFREFDFWTEQQLAEVPIYRDFFRPRGLGWSASTGLRMPTGDNIVLTIEREFGRGPLEKTPVEQLNELRPHLARAAFVSARLGLQRAQGANATLASLGLPALLLDEDGAVVEVNALIEAMPGQVQWRASNQVALGDRAANAQLFAALGALETTDEATPRSFPLRDADNRATMVAHVVPIRRAAHDLFARSYALLVLTPVEPQKAPSSDLMRSLFDLTTAEARVARGLVKGDTLDEIAAAGDVAISTVRSQLRQVLDKTGCARQAEVVALLANVTIDRGAAKE
ncbi:helix-turn-helix transcriptional regulator [Sphingomonas sp. RT2P30]|uniref:helix-turn-helix transcriptional regulator n=1 Tax=Parasphingomonas halimpatiens TaxID=3096162 RepID=UPI002FCBE74E